MQPRYLRFINIRRLALLLVNDVLCFQEITGSEFEITMFMLTLHLYTYKLDIVALSELFSYVTHITLILCYI